MKIAKITKIEVDNGVTAVTFGINSRQNSPSDFDLEQLGSEMSFLMEFNDMAMFNGETNLKVGDSITDEKGGQPIIGEVRGEAVKKSFSIVKENDYRDAFRQKQTGEGEK
jgi:hypothetical protein